MATGRPIFKVLIEYNCNSLEENDEKEKKPINIEFNDQNQILIMMKTLLTLSDQVYKKKPRKILLELTSFRTCKSKLMRINLFKKVTGWLFDDCSIVPNEKKNQECLFCK